MSASPRVDLASARERLERARRRAEETASPGPAAVRQILEARARELARPPPPPAAPVEVEALELAVGAERVAVDAATCREVVRSIETVEVPGLAPWFRGIGVHRGELLPAIALDVLLGAAAGALPTRGVIVGRRRPELALLVHEVGELLGLPRAALRPPPPGADPLVRALGPGALLVLSGEALLTDPRLFHGGERG